MAAHLQPANNRPELSLSTPHSPDARGGKNTVRRSGGRWIAAPFAAARRSRYGNQGTLSSAGSGLTAPLTFTSVAPGVTASLSLSALYAVRARA
jgi:hypothetical protein